MPASTVLLPLIKHFLRLRPLSPIQLHLALYRVAGVVANLLSALPLSLTRLFRLFRCDKQQDGWHHYGPTYDALFRPWKYRRVTLLEIGIGGGHATPGGKSLLAWQAYFPRGHIIGADIEEKIALAGSRREIVMLDQSSTEQLAALARDKGPFDLIVDDGSHFSAHQIVTFRQLFGALNDGGIYVIEDIQTSFWPGLVAGTVWDGAAIGDARFASTCQGFFVMLANYLNAAEFIDATGVDASLVSFARSIRQIAFEHNLIIVRKGDNRETSPMARLAGSAERP
jgi:hypothetical protein